MKKYLLFACIMILIGCDNRFMDPFGGTPAQKAGPPELNEQFALPIGKAVTLESEGLTIQFDSVPMDCRCPQGALCIWEGYVEVILHVTDSFQHSSEIRLSTLNGDKDNAIASFFSYRIELVEVMPYPIVDHQTDTTAYQALLIVRKSGQQ